MTQRAAAPEVMRSPIYEARVRLQAMMAPKPFGSHGSYWKSPPDNPWWPARLVPNVPTYQPPQKDFLTSLCVCEKCQRHIRVGEPCIFCLKARMEAVESRIDKALAATATRPKRKKPRHGKR
jgi:hypothetical protein